MGKDKSREARYNKWAAETYAQELGGKSEREACLATGMNRTTYRRRKAVLFPVRGKEYGK